MDLPLPMTAPATAHPIKVAFERNARALQLRPSIGRGTATTRVRLTGPLACEIEDGRWKLTADMAEKHGGSGSGPDPGVFGRAALGSCLAMSYAMWAAQMELPIDSLEVEVKAGYDARGHYGLDDVPPDYTEVRYIVSVSSPASESEIVRLLDQADAHTPYLQVFARPQAMRREIRYRRVEP